MRAFAVLAAILVCAVPAGALPQPISSAEKAAAEAASDYLARGPVAFYERLASDAPLRTLDRSDALQEIEVRAGEPNGASWKMCTSRGNGAAFEVAFPSGVDELVMLDMKDEAGTWKIASIHTLAERTPEDRSKMMSVAPAPVTPASPDAVKNAARIQVAGIAIAALILAMFGGATRHRLRVTSTFALLLSALGFCAQVAIIIDPRLLSASTLRKVRDVATATKRMPFAELRPLLRFRRAMARGEELPAIRNMDTEVAETAKLWKAQTLANAGGADVSTTLLSSTPLTDLLRARAAADLGHADEATKSYASFRQRVTAQDAFWFEQTIARPPRADTGPGIMFNASRDAGAYYMQSMLDVGSGSPSKARDVFRQAWRMQPMTRPDVVRAGFFAPLLRDPMISNLVNLNTPEESRTADVELGITPMKLPPNAKVSASGTFVRVTIERQSLDIPGGANIAPRDTEIVPATEWDRREDAEALQDFDQLVKSHLSSPSARLRAERTAEALAAHNRWTDVVTLTDSIKANETVPARLIVERVRALLRLHRNDEARALAKSPALGRSMQQNGADAGTLVELAELLTQAGAYDDAIDTYKRVESTKKGPDIAPRVRQVDLRRSLAASTPTATTEHFEIHSMPDVPVTVAERVGQLLEAELTRVTAHVALPQFSRVRVNILNWDDFSTHLTGTDDILGFYDGDITIPFGGVARFREQVVAILTHEMTHAVIAQASDDNAPRWFQEGLARRMELVPRQENIFQNRTMQQVPSISVLDAELEAGVDPIAVGEAYDEAATFMRFLEDRYGAQSINGLIASYRGGASTDEAFVSVTKKGTVDMDREFRDWGLNHSAAFLDSSPWPYAQFYSLGINPKVLEGFRWSKKPAKKP